MSFVFDFMVHCLIWDIADCLDKCANLPDDVELAVDGTKTSRVASGCICACARSLEKL